MSKKEKYTGPERRSNGWHLDKRVPITLIAAIFLQGVVFVYWGATLASQVGYNKDAITALSPTGERLAGIEAQLRILVSRWSERSRRTRQP